MTTDPIFTTARFRGNLERPTHTAGTYFRRRCSFRLPAAAVLGFALIAGYPLQGHADIPTAERDALLALYDETNNALWNDISGWGGAPGSECNWYGVTCDAGETTVTRLDLESNNLAGTLPADLGALTNLEQLVLYGNDLTGTIPPALGNLTNLRGLYLQSNQLTGAIPSELGDMVALRLVRLSGNELTGEIPPELGGLPDLLHAYMSRNQLTGGIPSELGDPTSLRTLHLADNQLTGAIPPELGDPTDQPDLDDLDLRGNRLSGEIPGNLINVGTAVDLRYNALHTDDSSLQSHLMNFHSDVLATQTVDAGDTVATSVGEDSVELGWVAVDYTADPGGYRIYLVESGGSFSQVAEIAGKGTVKATVTGLDPCTNYRARVHSYTEPHVGNDNEVESDGQTGDVAAFTTAGDCPPPGDGDDDGSGSGGGGGGGGASGLLMLALLGCLALARRFAGGVARMA